MKKTILLFVCLVAYSASSFSQSSSMLRFKSKNWPFRYVNLNKKVTSLQGNVKLVITEGSDLSVDNKAKITYSFGGKDYDNQYTVKEYKHIKDYHFWTLDSNTQNGVKVSISLYDQKQYIEAKDMYLKGILMINNNGTNSSFYLE